MRLIIHRGRPAAVASDRVHFAAHIDVLEPDHPERRFVAAKCLYSRAVDLQYPGGHYDDADADRFARALLMPQDEFEAIATWSDAELAALFSAPLDQVRARRQD